MTGPILSSDEIRTPPTQAELKTATALGEGPPNQKWKAQAPYGIHRSDWLQAITILMSAMILAIAVLVAAYGIP